MRRDLCQKHPTHALGSGEEEPANVTLFEFNRFSFLTSTDIRFGNTVSAN